MTPARSWGWSAVAHCLLCVRGATASLLNNLRSKSCEQTLALKVPLRRCRPPRSSRFLSRPLRAHGPSLPPPSPGQPAPRAHGVRRVARHARLTTASAARRTRRNRRHRCVASALRPQPISRRDELLPPVAHCPRACPSVTTPLSHMMLSISFSSPPVHRRARHVRALAVLARDKNNKKETMTMSKDEQKNQPPIV